MRKGNLLYSAVQFLFSVGIIVLGLFTIGFHYAPHLRQPLAEFIASSSSFLPLGFGLLAIGLLLLLGFYRMYRGTYYQFSMGEQQVARVDQKIIQEYVERYWEEQMPGEKTRVAVQLNAHQKIEIYLEWEQFSLEAQRALLESAEHDLAALLKEQFGYARQFSFSVMV